MPAPESLLPAIPAPAEGPDWVVVGLVLAIAGCFLLANAVLLRHPRELVEEQLGRAGRALGSIRGFIFYRVQVTLGFLLLLLGFGAQLLGRYVGTPAPDAPFPVAWVGATVVGVALLQLAGWWISQGLFRRHVREYLFEHQHLLDTDSRLAREVGELFGLELEPDETVSSYVGRLRVRIRLPRDVGPARRARTLEPDEFPEEEPA